MKNNNRIKKPLLIAGVILASLTGLKYGVEKLSDDDMSHKLKRAQEVLIDIKSRLDSHDLNPEERFELNRTYIAIQEELQDIAENQTKIRDKNWFVKEK
ncbi:MAG: hypothetical protein LBK12_04480 [Odoribacteraceae bacterium]|jgi:hypothetical protein|nr:hypothetical protein [Odoribacteraceae bacterium]